MTKAQHRTPAGPQGRNHRVWRRQQSMTVHATPGTANVAAFSLSEHAHALRSVYANRARGATGKIECNPARKWAAIIDHHSNGPSVLRIRNRYLRPERQRAMRSRKRAGIEGLTTRCPPPRRIIGRDYMLPRTRSVRFGVR